MSFNVDHSQTHPERRKQRRETEQKMANVNELMRWPHHMRLANIYPVEAIVCHPPTSAYPDVIEKTTTTVLLCSCVRFGSASSMSHYADATYHYLFNEIQGIDNGSGRCHGKYCWVSIGNCGGFLTVVGRRGQNLCITTPTSPKRILICFKNNFPLNFFKAVPRGYSNLYTYIVVYSMYVCVPHEANVANGTRCS